MRGLRYSLRHTRGQSAHRQSRIRESRRLLSAELEQRILSDWNKRTCPAGESCSHIQGSVMNRDTSRRLLKSTFGGKNRTAIRRSSMSRLKGADSGISFWVEVKRKMGHSGPRTVEKCSNSGINRSRGRVSIIAATLLAMVQSSNKEVVDLQGWDVKAEISIVSEPL